MKVILEKLRGVSFPSTTNSSSGSAQKLGMSTSLAAPTVHEEIIHNEVQDNVSAPDDKSDPNDDDKSDSNDTTGISYPPPPPSHPSHVPVPSNSASMMFSSPNSIDSKAETSAISSHRKCACDNNADLQDIERRFEIALKRARGLEIERMPEDGNCLFRAVASQVYADSELHDLIRHMCVDYMEREKHRYSEFITEDFAFYCKRKESDEVYGNNTDVRAISEMLNRTIHIYSYSTYPVYVFRGSNYYERDAPPILLSYHHGNHYNSLKGSLHGNEVQVHANSPVEDEKNIEAAIKAQMNHIDEFKASIKAHFEELPKEEIDSDLLLASRLFSVIEETEEKAMEAMTCLSRINDLTTTTAGKGDHTEKRYQSKPSSSAQPSSSSAAARRDGKKKQEERAPCSSSVQTVQSMGFSHADALRARRYRGDDVEAMVMFLLEANNSADWDDLPVMDAI